MIARSLLIFNYIQSLGLLPQPVWMQPSFSWSAIYWASLPLFVINMTSLKFAGIAMIKSYGLSPIRQPNYWLDRYLHT